MDFGKYERGPVAKKCYYLVLNLHPVQGGSTHFPSTHILPSIHLGSQVTEKRKYNMFYS